jgi:hypothetical protein
MVPLVSPESACTGRSTVSTANTAAKGSPVEFRHGAWSSSLSIYSLFAHTAVSYSDASMIVRTRRADGPSLGRCSRCLPSSPTSIQAEQRRSEKSAGRGLQGREWKVCLMALSGLASPAHAVDGQTGKPPLARKRTGSCRAARRCTSKRWSLKSCSLPSR